LSARLQKKPLGCHPSRRARSLEQALLEAIMDCLSTGKSQEKKASRGQDSTIMRRFHEVIEQRLDQALYVSELAER